MVGTDNKRQSTFKAENETAARKIWEMIKNSWLFALVGGLAGAALYGTTIVLTGNPASLISGLLAIGVGVVAGTLCKLGSDALQKPAETDSMIREDQIVVLDIRARGIQKYGLDIEKALFLVGRSQFYWVGMKTEWEKIKENFEFSPKLNTCPENEMARVMVVYSIKGPNEPILFSKGGIMGFLQRYAPHAQGEMGELYAYPAMKGNIMTYGFKDE